MLNHAKKSRIWDMQIVHFPKLDFEQFPNSQRKAADNVKGAKGVEGISLLFRIFLQIKIRNHNCGEKFFHKGNKSTNYGFDYFVGYV
jgi:hypothetical protein